MSVQPAGRDVLPTPGRLRRHLLALGLYTLAALIFTWPLAAHFTTHVTGDGIDDPALAWNLWWIFARLVEQHQLDIFHVDWMFHPIDINLAFYTLTPLNGLLSVPLQGALTLVIANNLLLLSSFVLGAYGTFLLTGYLLGTAPGARPRNAAIFWSALAAGLVYGFASSKLFYAALGQFNIVSSQWIPFCVLYLLRMTAAVRAQAPAVRPRRLYRDAALAALFLALQAYAELTYASFLIIFALALFVWTAVVLGRRRGPAAVMAALGRFVLLAGVFLLAIVPILAAMLPDMLREGDFFATGGGFADIFSADLSGYLMPTRLHPWLGGWVATQPFPNDKGQQIYLGVAVTLLALIGLVDLFRRRAQRAEAWLWLGTTLLFWWLTLGPTVRWRGVDLGIPGPFALVSQLPFFSGNRYPSRYSVMLMLCVAVLVGYGLRRLWEALSASPARPRLAAGITVGFVALFFLEHISVPIPLNDFRVPPIYARLAASKGDAVVLELPTGWRNGARVLGKSDVLIMMQQWYQTAHGQRRLGGNTSRNPAYKFQYFTNAPLIGDLIALMNSDDPRLAAYLEDDWDALVARNADAADVLDFLGVEHLVLHVDKAPPLLQRFVDEVLPVEAVDEWVGANWQGQPSEIRLYTVNAPAAAWAEVDLAAPRSSLYLAEGWSVAPVDERVRYAVRPQATLLLDLPATAHTLAFEMFGPATGADVTINGVPVGAFSAADDGWMTVPVPAAVAAEPVDRVTLNFREASRPIQALAQAPAAEGWPVSTTGVSLDASSSLLVQSAGEEVGNFAAIFLNGADVSLNQRGYNLAAVAPDGTLLGRAAFDTFAREDESAAMAAWIDQWPVGTIIAGAVADEASMHLEQTALAALAKLGVTTDLRGRFRWSHAFIGAVGAPVGSALEDVQLIHPALVSVGVPVNAPDVYAGIGRVRRQLSD
ncbi:MAG: hypothetical protein KDE20_01730 [Caldilineaceae bacterium]|nr:hypothetical protein [Caldilineaceae bacterium]